MLTWLQYLGLIYFEQIKDGADKAEQPRPEQPKEQIDTGKLHLLQTTMTMARISKISQHFSERQASKRRWSTHVCALQNESYV